MQDDRKNYNKKDGGTVIFGDWGAELRAGNGCYFLY
jgi:hypothetical protein